MNAFYLLLFLLLIYVLLLAGPAVARGEDTTVAPAASATQTTDTGTGKDKVGGRAPTTSETAPAQKSATDAVPAKPEKPAEGPPLPLHTIEGVGGIMITPTAYLVAPGPEDQFFSFKNLAVSGTYVGAGRKNVQTLALSTTFLGRWEASYGLSRFGLGTLRADVEDATGVDIGRDDVYLHNFNLRYLLVKESEYVPAVTAGAHLKVNDGIGAIDKRLGGALKDAGLGHTSGVDFTLTATKTFGNVFGRPLIASGGVRLSKAAQLGYLGFGDDYHASLEGNLTYLITDKIALAYEFRQKVNGYTPIGDLVRKEQNWQTVGVGVILGKNTTMTVGYGHFGDVLNTRENAGWAVQFKHEF